MVGTLVDRTAPRTVAAREDAAFPDSIEPPRRIPTRRK
jgi:hypothetical protein